MIWLMTGAWCAQAVIHDIPMERGSINANPATLPSFREKLWPCQKVTPSPDPCFFYYLNLTIHPALLHPSVHPCLPTSTTFAFSSHIKPLSILHALSLSLVVTLSHISLPSFNTQFASSASKSTSNEEPTCERTSSEDCVSTQTLCLIWMVLPEGILDRKKKKMQVGLEGNRVCGVFQTAGYPGDVQWCSGN